MKVRKIPDVLFEAQGGICFHCGLKMENISDSGPGVVGQGGWTREHLKARAMNGRNGVNVVLVHWACNQAYGSRRRIKKFILIKRDAIWRRAKEIQIGDQAMPL